MLLLPAGTAHRKVRARGDFQVVGCYAEGRDYHMLRGDSEDERKERTSIRALPLPRRIRCSVRTAR